MRPLLIILGALCLLASGCQLVPTDMFPKVEWYWSADAVHYRAEKHRYDFQNRTNRLEK